MAQTLKITLVEMIALIGLTIMTDILGFLFGFLGPIGALLNFFMTITVFPITFYYLRVIKKSAARYDVIANALEAVPILSMLPMRTIALS